MPALSDGPQGEYLTDRLALEAVKFIKQHRDRPFLLWFCPYAVHIPLQAKAELVARFETKARRISGTTGPRFRPEGTHKDRRVQDHAVYAAMLASLDEAVGSIVKALDDLGIADRTLIIFTSDNGGLSTAEGSPTSNAPLRAGKGWLYEGGIRVPLLIKGPRIDRPGRVSEVPVVTTDLAATMLDLAGASDPVRQTVDGISLLPLLKSQGNPEREAIFWHYPHYGNQGGSPGGAIRLGDWKLIEFFEDNHVELYNLKQDLGEQHDLTARDPRRAMRAAPAPARLAGNGGGRHADPESGPSTRCRNEEGRRIALQRSNRTPNGRIRLTSLKRKRRVFEITCRSMPFACSFRLVASEFAGIICISTGIDLAP